MVCDVRQGGVHSPVLFAVYVDDITERLNDSKLGCFIGDLYFGYIMYYDPDFELKIRETAPKI